MHDSTSTLAVLPEDVQERLLERLESDTLEVPLLPDVASQVLSLSTSEMANARTLAELIHRDQALASHVLRLANSAAYMPRTPIVSLQQAVSRLGMSTLREIVMMVSMQSRLFAVPGHEITVKALWRHAVATAAYAREIARLRRYNVEGAFLCGLLHDVGKPVILLELVDLQRQLGISLCAEAFDAALEAYHTEVGGRLATAWYLPPEVAESIAYHHHYTAAPTCDEAVRITCLADQISYAFAQASPGEVAAIQYHPAWADLNFYPDDIETLLERQEMIVRFVEGVA